MVLILDGTSDNFPLLSIELTYKQNKISISFHICAPISKLPYDISLEAENSVTFLYNHIDGFVCKTHGEAIKLFLGKTLLLK